jgi:hypothetical protein
MMRRVMRFADRHVDPVAAGSRVATRCTGTAWAVGIRAAPRLRRDGRRDRCGHGPGLAADLALVERIERGGALSDYCLLPATRADLLRRLGKVE